jgi:hypothetical protein
VSWIWRADLAVVVSGKTSGIILEGNSIDGEISRRGGGSYGGDGNTTNDVRMASSAPVPGGMPTPSPGDGFPPGTDSAEYTPLPCRHLRHQT